MNERLVIRGNYYYARFYVNGKPKMLSTKVPVKGNNKRKAKKTMKEIVGRFNSDSLDYDNIQFVSFLDEWLENMKSILKPSTWESYDKTVNGKIKPYFAPRNYRFKELIPGTFNQYFVFLSKHGKSDGEGGLSYKSVKNIRGVLSSAYEYAIEKNYTTENIVLKSRLPSFPHSIQKEVPEYNSEQVNQLLTFAKESDSHIYVFLLLALYTGLRKGELLALTWNDVDFDNKLLSVNKSRTGSRSEVTSQITTPISPSSNRKIPLNEVVLQTLKDERDLQEKQAMLYGNHFELNNYIVRTVQGHPYTNLSAINRVVNRLTKKAGLPHCTIYGFRHSVASILDDSGVAIQDIAVLLGHESVNSTERIFINRRKTAKASTINALDKAIRFNNI